MVKLNVRVNHEFNPNEYPNDAYLLDHFVLGSICLSGATLLTSLITSLQKNQLICSKYILLKEILFCKQILLDPASSCRVEILIEDNDKITIKNAKTDDTILIGKTNGNVESELPYLNWHESLASLKFSQSRSIIFSKDFYEFLSQFGYTPQASFHSVILLEYSNDCQNIIGRCTIQQNDHFDLLVDALFQAMVFCILKVNLEQDDTTPRLLLVPFLIGQLSMVSKERLSTTELLELAFKVNPVKSTGDCWIGRTSDDQVVFFAKDVLFRPAEPAPSHSGTSQFLSPSALASPNSTTTLPKKSVVVRSMACRLPRGLDSPEKFFDFIRAGKTSESPFPSMRIDDQITLASLVNGGHFLEEDIASFDARFFGISALEAEAMDPQQRLLLECAYECMENAGLTSLEGDTGFFVGFMGAEYPDLASDDQKRSALVMLGSAPAVVSGRLSYFFDANGPSITVDTACSSSLVAMDLAVQAIHAGKCTRAVVAGVNLILTSKGLAQRANGKLLSRDGVCRTFDAKASGYGRADGCVAVLIEGTDLAQPSSFPYLATVKAIEINHDGRSSALTAPNGKSQQLLIERCLRELSDSDKMAIEFWECHGTGTALGDPVEFVALENALEKSGMARTVWVGSAKASVGHSEAASGLVGLMKAICQLRAGHVPALAHFRELNVEILTKISQKQKKMGKDYHSHIKVPVTGVDLPSPSLEQSNLLCGVSSFGVSGTNACAVLSIIVDDSISTAFRKYLVNFDSSIKVLPVSAKSRWSLDANVANFLRFATIHRRSDASLAAVCAAAAINRGHFPLRTAFVFSGNDNMNMSKMVVPKTGTTIKFDATPWTTFPTEFYNKVPEYRMKLDEILELVGRKPDKVIGSVEIRDKALLTVSNTFARLKMLIEFGVIKLEDFDGEDFVNKSEFASLMISLLCNTVLDSYESILLVWKCVDKQIQFPHVDSNCKNQPSASPSSVLISSNNQDFTGLHTVNDLSELIALAYGAGKTLNWKKIYPMEHFDALLLIQLPNYAFDKSERFWFQCQKVEHSTESNKIESGKFSLEERREIYPKYTFKTPDPQEITDFLRKIISDAISLDGISSELTATDFVNTGLMELGVDSLGMVAILDRINQKYFANEPSKQVSSVEIFVARSVSDLALMIRKHLQDGLTSGQIVKRKADRTINKSNRQISNQNIDNKNKIKKIGKNNTIHEYITQSKTEPIEIVTPLVNRHYNKFGQEVPTNIYLVQLAKRQNSVESAISIKLQWKEITGQSFIVQFGHSMEVIQLGEDGTLNDCLIKMGIIRPVENSFGEHFPRIRVEISHECKLCLKKLSRALLFLGKNLMQLHETNVGSDKIRIEVPEENKPFEAFIVGFFRSFALEKRLAIEVIGLTDFQLVRPMANNEEQNLKAYANIVAVVPSGTWLITGGTSGIGLEMARYLAEFPDCSVDRLLLVSRRSPNDEKVLQKIARLERHCTVEVLQADISNIAQLESIFERSIMPGTLNGIIHSAGCLADKLFEWQTEESFEEVYGGKCLGAVNLERCLEKYDIQPHFFIINSSICALFGNPGQCNYSASNAFLDTLIRQRRANGLAGTTINWGNWLSVGMAERANVNEWLHSIGMEGLGVDEALDSFKWILEHNPEAAVVANVDWYRFMEIRPDLRRIFDTLTEINDQKMNLVERPFNEVLKLDKLRLREVPNCNNISKAVQTSSIKGLEDTIFAILTDQMISRKLLSPSYDSSQDSGHSSSLALEPKTTGFIEFGLDSLGLYTFANELNVKLADHLRVNFSISVIDLFEHSNVEKLSSFVWQNLCEPKECQNNLLNNDVITFEMINDHRIEGEAVVPAAVHLWMFEELQLGGKWIILNNVNFLRKVQPSELDLLEVRINQNGDLELMSSDEVVSNCHPKEQSVKMEQEVFFENVINDQKTTKKYENVLKDQRRIPTDLKEFYDRMCSRGMDYGSSMQLLQKVECFADEEAVISTMVSETTRSPLPDWSLYEFGLQTLSAALYFSERPEFKHNEYHIPFRIRKVVKNRNTCNCKRDEIRAVGRVTNWEISTVQGDVWVFHGEAMVVRILGIQALRKYATMMAIRSDFGYLENLKFNEQSNLIDNRSKKNYQGYGKGAGKTTNERSTNYADDKNHILKNSVESSHIVKLKSAKRVAVKVRGWSGRFSGPISLDQDFKFDSSSRSAIRRFKGELANLNAECFDAQFFGITPREAPFVDPQQRWLLEAAVEAIDSAALDKLDPDCGVFIGASSSDFAQTFHTKAHTSLISRYLTLGASPSALSGRLSHFFGLHGPCVTLDTACSSFGTALASACDALMAGKCRFALVGSVNAIIGSINTEVIRRLGVLSKKGRCATFDADADGYARAECVGMVLLEAVDFDEKSEESFEALSIFIRGWSAGHSGAGDVGSMSVPNAAGQQRVIEDAIKLAKLNGLDLDLVEIDLVDCHGSGTLLGDSVEVGTVLEVFAGRSRKQDQILLNASKTRYGHCEAAAGVVSFIEVLEVLRTGRLPPIQHFHNLSRLIRAHPDAEKIIVPLEEMEVVVKNVLINCFGINGTNTCAVVECQRVTPNVTECSRSTVDPSELLVLSAKTKRSLQRMIDDTNEFIAKNVSKLKSICARLQRTRTHYGQFRYARVVNASNWQDLHKLEDVFFSSMIKRDDAGKYSKVIILVNPFENASEFIDELRRSHTGFRKWWQGQPKSQQIEAFPHLQLLSFVLACILSVRLVVVESTDDLRFLEKQICDKQIDLVERSRNRDELPNDHFKLDLAEAFISDKNTNPSLALNQLFGQLYNNGIDLNFTLINPVPIDRSIQLPKYPFDRKRYWPFDGLENESSEEPKERSLVDLQSKPTLEVSNFIDDSKEVTIQNHENVSPESDNVLYGENLSSHYEAIQQNAISSKEKQKIQDFPNLQENILVQEECAGSLTNKQLDFDPKTDEDYSFYEIKYENIQKTAEPLEKDITISTTKIHYKNEQIALIDFSKTRRPNVTFKQIASIFLRSRDLERCFGEIAKFRKILILWPVVSVCDVASNCRNFCRLLSDSSREGELLKVVVLADESAREIAPLVRSIAVRSHFAYRIVFVKDASAREDFTEFALSQFDELANVEDSDVLRVSPDLRISRQRLVRLVEAQTSHNMALSSPKIFCLAGKVLITIGTASVAVQCLSTFPEISELVLVAKGTESNFDQILHKCKSSGKTVRIHLADCADQWEMERVFREEANYFNAIVYCPFVSDKTDTCCFDQLDFEIQTNVLMMRTLLTLAKENGVSKFVVILPNAFGGSSVGDSIANALVEKVVLENCAKTSGIECRLIRVGPLVDSIKGKILQRLMEFDVKKEAIALKVDSVLSQQNHLSKFLTNALHLPNFSNHLGELSKDDERREEISAFKNNVSTFVSTTRERSLEKELADEETLSNMFKEVKIDSREIEDQLCEMVADVTGLDHVDRDETLVTQGLDSHMVEQLRAEINTRHPGIELSTVEMYQKLTVSAIGRLLTGKMSNTVRNDANNEANENKSEGYDQLDDQIEIDYGKTFCLSLDSADHPPLFNPNESQWWLFPISAISVPALKNVCTEMAKLLRKLHPKDQVEENEILQQLAEFLQQQNHKYSIRTFKIVSSLCDLLEWLDAIIAGDPSDLDIEKCLTEEPLKAKNLAFFFSPQGVQYPQMLSNERQQSNFINKIFREKCALFSGGAEEMEKIIDTDLVDDPRYTQCSLFAVCMTISESLSQAGIVHPGTVFGHSVGEYLALCQANAFSASDCMRLLERRGELIAQTSAAKMLFVHPENVQKPPPELDLSAILPNNFCVYVGSPNDVEQFATDLKAKQVQCRILRTRHGFHSPRFLLPIEAKFHMVANRVEFAEKLNRKVISNVDGRILSEGRLNANYLCEHLVSAVRLDLSFETLNQSDVQVIVEIGPPGLLAKTLISESPQNQSNRIHLVQTMFSRSEMFIKQDPVKFPRLVEAIGRLWQLGFTMDFTQIFQIPTDKCNFTSEFNHLFSRLNKEMGILREPKIVRENTILSLEKNVKKDEKMRSNLIDHGNGRNYCNQSGQLQRITTHKDHADDRDFSDAFISVLKTARSTTANSVQLNVYCVHAISGTTYQYYQLVQFLPNYTNVFGINYSSEMAAKTLAELAQFYAKNIYAHSRGRPFLLCGHSMGGVLAREMADFLNKSVLIPKNRIKFVVCFDSWPIGEEMKMAPVRDYIERQFHQMPNRDELLFGALKLARMLKMHRYQKMDIGIRLFKAKYFDARAPSIETRERLEQLEMAEDNGWFSSGLAESVKVFVCEADHDGVLQTDALRQHSKEIHQFCKDVLSHE